MMDEEMDATLLKELLTQAEFRLRDNHRRLLLSMNHLSDQEIWRKPNANSNSVGNLILHLCGNISHFIGTHLGNTGFIRNRPREFTVSGGLSKEELLSVLAGTLEEACTIILSVGREELLKVRDIDGFSYSGLAIIMHVVQHFAYHTGQILFWTKLLRDQDLKISSFAPNSKAQPIDEPRH